MAHKGKATSDITYNPDDGSEAYSNSVVYSRLHDYTIMAKTGRSGYPFNSGRVVRVLLNSGNGNWYPIAAKKKRYPQVRVRVRVYPIYPKYIKAQLVSCLNFSSRIYSPDTQS
jgi:hypothetical protein